MTDLQYTRQKWLSVSWVRKETTKDTIEIKTLQIPPEHRIGMVAFFRFRSRDSTYR